MKQASTLDLNNIIQYLDSSELVFFLATKDTEKKQLLTFFVNMFQVVIECREFMKYLDAINFTEADYLIIGKP